MHPFIFSFFLFYISRKAQNSLSSAISPSLSRRTTLMAGFGILRPVKIYNLFRVCPRVSSWWRNTSPKRCRRLWKIVPLAIHHSLDAPPTEYSKGQMPSPSLQNTFRLFEWIHMNPQICVLRPEWNKNCSYCIWDSKNQWTLLFSTLAWTFMVRLRSVISL